MKLVDVASGSKSIPISDISADPALATEIQNRLIDYGLLDPPADGKFGPVSIWALTEFCSRKDAALKDGLSIGAAKYLLGSNPLPIKAGSDLAGRIAACMNQYNYWVNRDPDCLNIVYVEGMNLDGTPNDNRPNHFNDCRCLLSIDNKGKPVLRGIWKGTTEPSKYWTEIKPMNKKGAARIAFGQYKAWTMGWFITHDALKQVEPIKVFRDLNKDYDRKGDLPDVGLFGIHHHWGFDYPDNDLGRASAGCLVGQKTTEHNKFIRLLKDDPRFKASNYYRFMATIVPYRDLPPA